MAIFSRCTLLMAVLVTLTGCASQFAASRPAFSQYPFHHEAFDFKTAWRTSAVQEGLAVDGIIQNVRYAQVKELEVMVTLLNPQKNSLSEATVFPVPVPLDYDGYQEFRLVLKNAPLAKGDLLRFTIRYRAVDDDRSTTRWVSIFTVDAMTGVEVEKPE